MTTKQSVSSIIMFASTVLCFFLPFITVSCGDIKAFTLTGQQLATGTTLAEAQPFGPPKTQAIGADPFAALAGLCAIAGLAFSLLGNSLRKASVASGAGGAISLFIMRLRLENQIQTQGQGVARITFETGYTFALLLLAGCAAWNLYLLQQRTRKADDQAIPPTGQMRANPAGSPPLTDLSQPPVGVADFSASGDRGVAPRHCIHCGQAFSAPVHFCESCGKPTGLL
jgi:hypothetical protein